MKVRRVILLLASFALGALLVGFLLRLGRVNLGLTMRELKHVSPANMLKLLLLNGLLVLLSTMKWRTTDSALRHPSDSVPSRITAYTISSLGMALGLVLPVQFGMTAARTAGTLAYGRTLKRGTGGTVFEQAFDLLVTVLLSLASVVTWLGNGGAWIWGICALTVVILAVISVKPLLWLMERLLSTGSEKAVRSQVSRIFPVRPSIIERFLQTLYGARQSALASPRLVRRLLVLSAFRFAVVVLMAEQIAVMTGADIRLWTMAAAIPFAAISNFVAITPGGVGVNELTSVTALHVFGTPSAIASQWAITNRILMTESYFIVAMASMAIAAIAHSSLQFFGNRRRTTEVKEV